MNIKQFKVGDIITRNEPCDYGFNEIRDSSYCGDRCELVGHDETSKIIFLKTDKWGDITSLSYARETWDEGWCLYPETLWQKLIGKLK